MQSESLSLRSWFVEARLILLIAVIIEALWVILALVFIRALDQRICDHSMLTDDIGAETCLRSIAIKVVFA